MSEMYADVDTALAEVPVNIAALIDDTTFKDREESVTYDQAGMDLVWNFFTTAGAYTQTAVTPTTSGDYDWTNQGNGMYSIEIPASGGASINNDTEGFGWFSGFATGVLPWRGPIIGFRAAGINNLLIDSASSATRGLAGTALPDAVADAAGGLPISDTGGLDLDTQLANTNEITAARMGALTDWIDAGRLDAILDTINTNSARLTAARAQVLDDWINAGRLDLILDIIAADTTTDIPALIATAQADLDVITDGDGVILGAAGVDLIIDEVLTGATHNVNNSLGRRIRELADLLVLDTGTAQAGAASQITLAAGANANNNFYDHTMIVLTDGTGVGQARTVNDGYDGTTKVAPIVPNWVVNPDATTKYEIFADTEKHVAEIHAGAIVAASFAADAVDANALAADAAAEIVDAWETQSQADPTGFHVNVLEIGGTAQTANDNGADINAILVDTNELQTDWTNGGRLDLILDIIAADTTTDIPALIAALNDLSAANVNAEMVDVMATDTQTLPGQAAPPNGPTYQEIWTWLYKAWRNKWDVDSGGGELYNDAGAVVDSKFSHSDDGTNYVKNEVVAGP